MSEFPMPDVIYRIRNVDTRLYLERTAFPAPAPGSGFPPYSTPQMRPEDATSKRQHWKFVKFPAAGTGQYRILDPVRTGLQGLSFFSNAPPMTENLTVGPLSGNNQHINWTINAANPDENSFFLVANDPDGWTLRGLGNTLPSNITPFVGFQVLLTSGNPPPTNPSFQWQISEVSPADLAKDPNSKYRIRAFLGKPLQVDASGNLNLDPTDARGDHRVWIIVDKGNGKCTVYSEKAQRYLTTTNVSTSGGFDWRPTLRAATEPTFTEADRLWTFEKTTSLTHTIFVERQTTDPTENPATKSRLLALALDGNNAILKPKKLAHNEVWLVEPIDTPMPGNMGGGSGGPSPGVTPGITLGLGFPPGLRGDVIYRVRTPEFPSIGNPVYLRLVRNGAGQAFLAGASAQTALGLRVEIQTSGRVALYTLDAGLTNLRHYLGLNGTLVVANELSNSDNAYPWTVTRISLTDTGGQYIIAAANGQLLSTPNSNSLTLTIATNPPSSFQVWAFVPSG